MAWQTLKVGGGGYVTGISVANDGAMVVRTDTNGAYLRTGSQWLHIVTASSMPASFDFKGEGVYEIQVAANNSNVIYMTFDGYVFKSTNKGTTWTQTAFSGFNDSSDPANDSYRMNGQKIAIDPNNPNIVYVGTPSNGLYVSKDGGSTWSKVSTIPAAAGQGITGILFDPAVGGVVDGVTQAIFASSYGHGVYESTNGGATWTARSGGPTDVVGAAVSSTGVYYASDGSNLWAYASGKWTKLTSDSAGIQAVAVNPSNPSEIVAVSPAGFLDISYNAGATWTGTMFSSNQVTSADIPWLADAQQAEGGAANFLSLGGATFNPTNPNQMILTGGTGVWTTTQVPTSGATSSTPVTWTDQSVGIENLVANEIIVPPGGDPVLASWDRPFFKITNPNSYPTTYGPVASDNIVAGWSVDYASSSPSFLVGIADWWGTEESGYSTNGGQTWTKFPTEIPGAGSSFMGGTIAASTTQNFIWAPAGGQKPYYTLNGGSTWTPITLPGVSSWSGFDWVYYLDQRSVTADRVLASTFYLYDPGKGVFETTNGGASWTNVHSGYIESNGSMAGFNSTIMSVPGEAGNLFYTGGSQSGSTPTAPVNEGFYRSTDGGKTWSTVANVLDVSTFGFGAAAPGQSSPAIYIVGYVNSVYGIWQSINNAQSWTNIGTYPNGELDPISTISGNPNVFGKAYVGFGDGGGYAYLPPGSTAVAPTIAGTVSGQTTTSEAPVKPFTHVTIGDANVGATDTLTITLGGAGGALSGTGLSAGAGGVYTLSGTAAAITSELDALIFTPTAGAPNTSSKTTFTLSDLSSANGAPSVDSKTSVIDSDPAQPPPTITSSILFQNTDGQVSIWEMNGISIVGGGPVANPGPSWYAIGTGDFNDDKHSDILMQNTGGQVSVWEMNGNNIINGGPVANPGPSWHAVGTGDFNDDNHSDILMQNTSSGQVSVWEMNGNKIVDGGPIADPGPSWRAVGTGDFNDDKHSDILMQNTGSGEVSVWEMNGNKIIDGGPVADPGPSWHAIGTGDFNGDSHSDILMQNTSSGQVSVWEMNGNKIMGGGPVADPGPSWHAIGTGGGSSSDILMQNTSSGQVSIWDMNGNTIIGGGPVANPGPSWYGIGLT